MAKDLVTIEGGFHPDHEEEIRYFKENKVYSVQIESNLACGQGCLYCYASSKDSPMKDLAREHIVSVLDSAVRMEARAIDWLGGDPLLRKDWYELMALAKEKGLRNNIWTSGLLLEDMGTARRAVQVSEGGFISVHLDSLDEGIYSRLHTGDARRKIDAILKGVDNVQSLGKPPGHMINCITFTKEVTKDARRTIEHFYKEKGMKTCLTQMCLEGMAEDKDLWVPNRNEIKEACEARDDINYPGADSSMCTMDTNKFYCGGIVCVTVDGDVTPCSVIRKGYGNIRDDPLDVIVDTHRRELLYIPLRHKSGLPNGCIGCSNTGVCWGCRAAAYCETGDIFGMDPKCYNASREFGK